MYTYTQTDISSQETIIFPVEAYCLQVTRLPPFFYVWPSYEPVKQNQFTNSAKKKTLKQRKQLSGTRNAVLKLLKTTSALKMVFPVGCRFNRVVLKLQVQVCEIRKGPIKK